MRTGYSFRKAFGSIEAVAERLKEIGCGFAAVVDTLGTWGHVRWEAAALDAGIEPGFGYAAPVELENSWKPVAWALALNQADFYEFTSSDPKTEADWIAAAGKVVRFSGAALTDPDAFDYIDLNPSSFTRARQLLELAEKTGKPLVLTGDNDYPAPDDYGRFLGWVDARKSSPHHILAADEWRGAFWWLDDETFEKAAENTRKLAKQLEGLRLKSAPIISVPGDLSAMVQRGKEYRLGAGHIEQWTDEYEARLQREMEMIKLKEYESYFIVVAELVIWAKQHMLVGPARGSSAGSLVCYLLQITEVDPLPHGLLFERFIDVNRNDLPDIDIDFSDKKRHMVFDYLGEKYGVANVAKIGSINFLKARSAIAHVGKKLAIPAAATFAVANVLFEYSSGDARYGKGLHDTLHETKPGQKFMSDYPEGKLMGELELHPSHSGVHAAGIIVANEPVTHYCTVQDGIAHIDKKDAERLNLLKIDALGLRTLGVIEDAGVTSAEQLYGLKLDDPEVFKIFNEKKFAGIFQFEGAAQRSVTIQIPITDFKKIDHCTALARPGPFGGGATDKYVMRNAGRVPVEYRHPSMAAYLSETMGVVLYQEQVMRISFEIGRMPWEVVSELRRAMSASKGKEYFQRRGAEFVSGAVSIGVPEADAIEIWDEICSFGAWGMNKSHTVSYAIISYWCAYLKRYHPLEYAAACLRNAKDDEQAIELLRELHAEGINVVAFDPHKSGIDWKAGDGALLGGFTNLHGIGPVKARYWVEKRETEGLSDEDLEKLKKHPPKHQDLFPAHTLWGDIYANPEQYNIHGRVRQFSELADQENAVVICRLVKKDRRDRNETRLIQKRGGSIMKGQTQFLDMHVVDDSVGKPVTARLGERDWAGLGELIADRAVDGVDWFLIRGRWLKDFNMLIVKKVKPLTTPDMLTP